MTSFEPVRQLKFLRLLFFLNHFVLGGICPVSLIYRATSCDLCVFSLGMLGRSCKPWKLRHLPSEESLSLTSLLH